MKHVIILCSTILLMGCSIYKPYVRPDIKLETNALYGRNVEIEDTASIAILPWTKLFTDSMLQKLIREGLEYNTDLKIACLRVKEAEATLLSSRFAYLPSVSFTPQGGISSYDRAKTAKTYTLASSAEWEIDLFGKLTNAKRGARAALESSVAYRQAVQTQLIATIANSYYNLLMLDRQLDISYRTADSWAEVLRTYEVKMKVGEATEAAIAQAKAGKLSVDASILTLRKQIRTLENSLSALLGSVPRQIERSTLEEQQFPDTLAIGVPLQLLERRPDVRQAEQVLAQAFYVTNTARSAFYPSITLSGSAGWTNNTGMLIVNPGSWLLNALGSLTQPLFNRGKNIANLRIAKAQQEEAILSFRQSLLKAGNEVNDALMQWQTANTRLEIIGEQVVTLQSAVDNTRKLMEHSNNSTYLEVLTAQQSFLQAQLTEVSDKFDKIQGVINLYHALGGGVE
jgi:NodT family efflux transporter outer membrane factor (OMF) lipoprotein